MRTSARAYRAGTGTSSANRSERVSKRRGWDSHASRPLPWSQVPRTRAPCTNPCNDQCGGAQSGNHYRTEQMMGMQSERGKYPSAHNSAKQAEQDVGNHAIAPSADQLSGEPSGNESDQNRGNHRCCTLLCRKPASNRPQQDPKQKDCQVSRDCESDEFCAALGRQCRQCRNPTALASGGRCFLHPEDLGRDSFL